MKILSFAVSGCVASMLGVVSTAIAALPVSAGSYCLALRGNGELAPAHWGALAQVVEKKGLPEKMSGGSSASISLFLLESISQNPAVTGKSRLEQRKAASLLLKSLQSYLESVIARPEWQEMAQLATHFSSNDVRKMEFAKLVKAIAEGDPEALSNLDIKRRIQILESLEQARDIGVVDFQALSPLYDAIMAYKSTANPADHALALARIEFRAGEVYSSLAMLGKFNAETDHNLFFRPGIVNFRELARSFGASQVSMRAAR